MGSYKVFFIGSLADLPILRLRGPPAIQGSWSPLTVHARSAHQGFWPDAAPLPAEAGTGVPRTQEYQYTTQPTCTLQEQGLGTACAFVGQVATFVLNYGCLPSMPCVVHHTHKENGVLSTRPAGAELFPLIRAAIAFKLDTNLLQVQADGVPANRRHRLVRVQLTGGEARSKA